MCQNGSETTRRVINKRPDPAPKEYFRLAWLRLAIGIVCLLVCARPLAAAEGTLSFGTFVPGLLDYPVIACGGPVSGSNWTAQLWIGPPQCTEDQLVPLSPSTDFRTDIPGYVVPVYLSAGPLGFGGGSTPTLQMRVWNNQGQTVTAYSNATIRGSSPRRITAFGGRRGRPNPRTRCAPVWRCSIDNAF
jgi:hypothetical protein